MSQGQGVSAFMRMLQSAEAAEAAAAEAAAEAAAGPGLARRNSTRSFPAAGCDGGRPLDRARGIHQCNTELPRVHAAARRDEVGRGRRVERVGAVRAAAVVRRDHLAHKVQREVERVEQTLAEGAPRPQSE